MACGYQHEFLKPHAKLKKYECPACRCVTRVPYLTDCCGQHFCQACISRILTSENTVVPCCGARNFNVMIDKKQRRKVLKLKVRCTMRDCNWSGRLRKYDRHVDMHCPYVHVRCSNHCGETFQRHHLAKHLSELCPKRPFTCEYCGFEATYEDMSKHYPDCIKYPVTCPNICEIGTVERGNLEQHVSECPLQVVKCYFGCSKRMKREGLPKHVRVCPKRPFTCNYCEFKATYEQVRNDHYPKCVEYPVPCPNKCEIRTVERGTLEQHVSECPLQVVECEFGCSERIKREGLPKHVRVCRKRPFTCKYCKLKATYEQVCNDHYPKCVKYPVPCPNNCDIGTVERGNLEQHVSKCPLQVVECDYSYAGCNEKIIRKDLAMHKELGKDDHLLLLSDFSWEAQKKLDERNNTVSCAEFKVVDFSMYKRARSNKSVAGHVLYTHLMGAKIEIHTSFIIKRLSPDGEEDVSYDREVQLELWQLPGEFDKMVKWPVQCTVTAKLLDQYGRRHMTESTEDIVLNRPNKCAYLRDLLTVNFATLKNSPRFLRNDTLKFNVAAVKLT